MMETKAVYTTKSDYVHNTLKQKILSGELSMGDSINISKISEELNVSIIPVREAVKRLETEGLVVTVPHKGAQVKSFDLEKIKEIYAIRAVLEGLAAKSAIPNMDPEKIKRLKEITEEMRQYALDGEDERFGITNKEFHRFIYQHSTYPMLYDMIFNLWDGNWAKSVFAFNHKRMFEAVEEHLEIIKAIEEKDEEKTEQLVRQHKLNIVNMFEKISKNNLNADRKMDN
jgi:DNA-binding GntR family transcriptional regulator